MTSKSHPRQYRNVRFQHPTMKAMKKKRKPAAKPLIIIDPGHGGVDPGTIGPDGTQEKDVVLEYAPGIA